MPDPVEEPTEDSTVDDLDAAEERFEAEALGQAKYEVGHHRPADG